MSRAPGEGDGVTVDREPPWSAEAEHAVLGAVLLDNFAFERVAEVLESGDFYAAQHAAIWRTVVALQSRGRPADVVTVAEEGGHDMAALNRFAASIPSAANAHRYAAIVRERSIERQMVRLAGQAIDVAHAPGVPVADKVDRVQGLFAALQARREGHRDPVPIEPATVELLDYVQAMADGKNPAISTGLRNLDRATAGGIRPGVFENAVSKLKLLQPEFVE